jgi:hypothetical protein
MIKQMIREEQHSSRAVCRRYCICSIETTSMGRGVSMNIKMG